MKPLAAFDCMALAPNAPPRGVAIRIHGALPKAVMVTATDSIAQIEALRAMTGAYVLVLPPNILPSGNLAAQMPDPILLEAGYRIAWLARNPVTGQSDASPAPELWLRDALVADLEGAQTAPTQRAIMPFTVADWSFNYASRPSFTAGFDYAGNLQNQPNSAKRLGIAASFGSDMPFADWWHLGVLRSLMGGKDATVDYDREKAGMARDVKMQDRLRDLRRKANADLGLNAERIDKVNAAFFRRNRFSRPDAEVYADLIAAYETLGQAGKKVAAQWREAARWVWGGSATKPSE